MVRKEGEMPAPKLRPTETTHLHSHSRYSRYDDSGVGLVSTGDACEMHLPPRQLSLGASGPNAEERQRASRLSLYANIGLLILKVFVSYLSGSLAFVASAVDSLLDLVSQTIIFWAMRGNENVDQTVWPLGRSRLEPVGIVVVASLMGMASLQVVMESLFRLVSGFEDDKKIKKPEVNGTAVFLLLFTIGLKFVLYLVCRRLASTSDTMNALANDHRNDILSNAIALLAAGLASRNKSLWYFDPFGAIGISVFIVMNWIEMAREQTDKLVGRAADSEFVEKVKQIAQDHDERMSVDIIRAFYFGHRYLVEIEVVMPDSTTLRVAHDVALDLQQKVELLQEVERCHVHVDYDFRTEPEHKANFNHENSTASIDNV